MLHRVKTRVNLYVSGCLKLRICGVLRCCCDSRCVSLPTSECSAAETQYGKCVPEQGDCGDGLREATCKDRNDKIHCKIPCNWKKDISKTLGRGGSCDAVTNTKNRSGTLKRALFNAECQTTVKVSKPCSPKAKKTRAKEKKEEDSNF
uniref:Midkine n=1 Tax=Lates calcarifer TaxID=8187 RepID=A0A4W6EUE8_LATCA